MEKKRVLKIVWVLLYCSKCCCVECDDGAGKGKGKGKFERVMVSMLLGSITGLGCALVCGWVVRCILRYIKRFPPVVKGAVVFSAEMSMCGKSLESAVRQREEEGRRGSYYMTTTLLPDPADNNNNNNNNAAIAIAIAVKKFEMGQGVKTSVKREIQRKLEILGSLRHRHVMRLRAYVCESDRFCLVYDYVPTGSLEDAMKRARENQLHLGWDARLRIAVGIIKGLQFLHLTTILHSNLKPANVMLDADFEPRLGDCGLANLMRNFDPNANASPYYAPECFPNFSIYTEKSDIFSFGVILGILLTGRDPSDPLFGASGSGSGSDMGMWFRQVLEAGDAREALDKSLLGEEMEEDEMLMAVRIAAVCLSDMPSDRPSSHELVPMLTQLHSF